MKATLFSVCFIGTAAAVESHSSFHSTKTETGLRVAHTSTSTWTTLTRTHSSSHAGSHTSSRSTHDARPTHEGRAVVDDAIKSLTPTTTGGSRIPDAPVVHQGLVDRGLLGGIAPIMEGLAPHSSAWSSSTSTSSWSPSTTSVSVSPTPSSVWSSSTPSGDWSSSTSSSSWSPETTSTSADWSSAAPTSTWSSAASSSTPWDASSSPSQDAPPAVNKAAAAGGDPLSGLLGLLGGGGLRRE